MVTNVKKRSLYNGKRRLIFYSIGVIWPVAQFLVFYLYVNFNSIILSFQKLDYESQRWVFVGFENFKQIFLDFAEKDYMWTALKNTFIVFAVHTFTIITPIFTTYYLFKKRFFSSGFKVLLFLPAIISSMALILCYKYFADVAMPEILLKITGVKHKGLMSDINTRFPMLLFYSAWFGMGSNFLLYLGAMSGISDSVIEAAQLDGVTPSQELFKIVIPLIFPTISTFIITSFATMFTNQINVFAIWGATADYDVYTTGYFIYMKSATGSVSEYPYLSAFGIMLTAIAVPLCFGTRYLFKKIGPSNE